MVQGEAGPQKSSCSQNHCYRSVVAGTAPSPIPTPRPLLLTLFCLQSGGSSWPVEVRVLPSEHPRPKTEASEGHLRTLLSFVTRPYFTENLDNLSPTRPLPPLSPRSYPCNFKTRTGPKDPRSSGTLVARQGRKLKVGTVLTPV